MLKDILDFFSYCFAVFIDFRDFFCYFHIFFPYLLTVKSVDFRKKVDRVAKKKKRNVQRQNDGKYEMSKFHGKNIETAHICSEMNKKKFLFVIFTEYTKLDRSDQGLTACTDRRKLTSIVSLDVIHGRREIN